MSEYQADAAVLLCLNSNTNTILLTNLQRNAMQRQKGSDKCLCDWGYLDQKQALWLQAHPRICLWSSAFEEEQRRSLSLLLNSREAPFASAST